jgi:hypothetical protein
MPHDQASAGKTFADVIVRLSLQLEREAARRERAKALAR